VRRRVGRASNAERERKLKPTLSNRRDHGLFTFAAVIKRKDDEEQLAGA